MRLTEKSMQVTEPELSQRWGYFSEVEVMVNEVKM